MLIIIQAVEWQPKIKSVTWLTGEEPLVKGEHRRYPPQKLLMGSA